MSTENKEFQSIFAEPHTESDGCPQCAIAEVVNGLMSAWIGSERNTELVLRSAAGGIAAVVLAMAGNDKEKATLLIEKIGKLAVEELSLMKAMMPLGFGPSEMGEAGRA